MASRKVRIAQLIVSVLVLVLAAWLFIQRQYVSDMISVWRYEPSSEMRRIVQRASMAGKGEFYFYASQPRLLSRDVFHNYCSSYEEAHSVVLGCYAMRQIYIFNVEDERLDGILEVTAAHEMLHAAYERLSASERQRVAMLLEREMERLDGTVRERLEVYKDLSAADRLNELHSVIGTEVAEIGGELEEYYARYFEDRQKVVSLYHQYESTFRSLREQQVTLVNELDNLAQHINNRTAAYNIAVQQLNSDILEFNARAQMQGGFSTQAEFQAARNELAARQANLEVERQGIDAERRRYEDLQVRLEALNLEHESLRRSIDSTLQPVPSV